MRDRKNRFAIDASLCLLHDIQNAKNSKNVFSCLFLDVKDAFNHVSTKRLIAILHKLKMPNQLIRWVKLFMIDRKIELAFDGKKQAARVVRTGIPQGWPILPILFSIYIRFLFLEKKNINTQILKCQALLTMLLSKSNQKAQKKIANY